MPKRTLILHILTVIFLSSVSAQTTENLSIAPTATGQSSDTASRPSVSSYGQDTYEDLNKTYPMDAPNPDNVRSVVDYDPVSGLYFLRTYVGDTEISTPYMMTEQEYYDFSEKQAMNRYWREKGQTEEGDNEKKFSITDMKFDIGPADKIFGPGGVQIKTQGSAELTFGIRHNKIDNPSVSERLRKNTTPNFDQKIQLNVNAKVGTRVNFNMNYNTESSFSFDQKMVKLGFKGEEDDIIQNLEIGNVSMQLNSSLIAGSSALFGIKSDLKFGKLKVSAIVSQQQSESQTVSSKGGSQTTDFEIGIDAYDENRHFFLAHYFRDNFETAMSKLPYVASGVKIDKLEVWVTNKRGKYDNSRNIIAFMDLAEVDSIWQNGIKSSPVSGKLPDNRSNDLYKRVISLGGIRDIQQTNQVLSASFPNMKGGEDYEKIESARLLDTSEYTYNEALGILSLRTALNPDEVLGVAFTYTYMGKTYTVGELSRTNTSSSDSTSTSTEVVEDVITTTGSSSDVLVVKMLKSTNQITSLPMWNLMMKNVYYLGTLQLQQEDFKLDIVYRNDSVGTDMRYLTEGAIKNQILLRVMNLDRLNQRQQAAPDGYFDYVEGYTVLSSSGRIIFPVLEPFGSHLRKVINNDQIANKYVYQELYDMTLVEAQEYSDKNKFKLIGEYKASSGKEIRLNAMNVPRGSVTVTAGGRTLVENVDYTVDYMMGTVTILDQSLLESNTNIDVKLENQALYSMQRKTLLGTHVEYEFSKNFTLGGTIMHLSETPLTTKVNTGSEPISNTIWGLNTSWRGESQWLTNMLDKLPFVNATQPSSFAVNAEFAQLVPGHSKDIGESGYAYIDDFDATKTTIDIHHPYYWKLSSTPSSRFASDAASDSIQYGENRALLAWYFVDPILNSNSKNAPANLRTNPDLRSNHLTRNVDISEIYPNRKVPTTQSNNLTVMNLSFYPQERGPYNLDTDHMNGDGTLQNPDKRWGGIMRKIDNPDFENSNIEYIEFWMMDPFINDEEGTHEGGSLYFNLGDISEDVLKDGKKFFEQGLDPNGNAANNDSTLWGYVPKIQSTVSGFSNDPAARTNQDVGLNGLKTEQEFNFGVYKEYIEKLEKTISESTKAIMRNNPNSPLMDPGGDNFHHYRGSDYDQQEFDILRRYKYYNGTEGNSNDASESDATYATNSTRQPDTEDINGDNTLNEYEKFYEYRIPIRRDSMELGTNYITEIVEKDVDLPNGTTERVRWYQYKIPLVDATDTIGGIRNFKSIRFVRMFLTDFEEEIHLRFATLDLVRGDWRTYTKPLHQVNQQPITDGQLDVQSVNIEENGSKTPVNYVLPPGVSRQTTPGQMQLIPQNEQALVLRVNNLAPNDARGVYKRTSYDMRQYKRLQMFVHAEEMVGELPLANQELSCFVRLGTDMTSNYYEYEIPLVLTPAGMYSSDDEGRLKVWPKDNMFDFPFSELTKAKLARNKAKQMPGSTVNNITPYYTWDTDKPNNRITVVGNPTLSEVKNIMIGVRNRSSAAKTGEIWVNELRMTEFDEGGGWAAMADVAVALSDIATINVAGRTESAGFGSIESNVLDRRMDDLYQISFSTSLDVGRFLPEKAKLQIPTYFSYTNETLSPKYDPMDEDILFSESLSNLSTKEEKDSLKEVSRTVSTSKSFNISNARVNIKSKKPQFYDPANLSITFAHNERNEHSPDIEKDYVKEQKLALDYSYSFNSEPVEPFKNVKALDKPAFRIIKDFNFYYLPTTMSFNTSMVRQFSQIKLRDFNVSGSTDAPVDLTFSKDFMWTRQFNIGYNLSKGISLNLQAATNASVLESYYTPEIGKEYYEAWRDTVWASIRKLGEPYTYQQTFTASWNVPINKLPFLDWTSLNASYNGNYNWNRTAEVEGVELGNIVNTMNTITVNGRFNFEQLYNKSKYLKKLNTKSSQKKSAVKFQPKSFSQTVNLKKGEALKVNHQLGSESIQVFATDSLGKKVKLRLGKRTRSSVELIAPDDMENVGLAISTIDPNKSANFGMQLVDFTARTLMLVRSVSFSYRESNSLLLPGFMPSPTFMGQERVNNVYAPGVGFAFGFFNEDKVIDDMAGRGWLTRDSIGDPAVFAKNTDLDLKASLEPFAGFKIELNAKEISSTGRSVQYRVDGVPIYSGSYSITQVAIGSAFKRIGSLESNYSSETFEQFKSNRSTMARRLNGQYRGTRYPDQGFISGSDYAGQNYGEENGAFYENSPEVLIPAFLAAYTGRDINKIGTSPFLSLASILPNWRVTYDGLTRIPWVANNFRSVSLTHAYICKYSVDSYSSYSSFVPMEGSDMFGYVQNTTNDNPVPSLLYDIPSVSLTEQFSPLIGINITMKNSMTTKFEYRKQRNLSLNLVSTQLIDGSTDEFVVGVGYTLKDFDIILRVKSDKQKKVKNDLKLNVDLSLKDNKMLLRRIDDNVTQATSGNKVFAIKIMADYVFSAKVNLQAFFDHQATNPLISTSFPVTTTNFGLGIKFMLTR